MSYGNLNNLNSIASLGASNKSAGTAPPPVLISSFSTYPDNSGLRNNFDGSVGFTFQVNSTITVVQLGNLFVTGNNQDTNITLWISTNQVTPLMSGTVLHNSPVDGNSYQWTTITPVQLTTGNTYGIAATVSTGGNMWKDLWTATSNINSTYISNVADGYSNFMDQYPVNHIGLPGQMFNAAAMLFTSP